MPGRTTKYTHKTDGELKMRVLAVLDAADDSVMPTLDWIKTQDMILNPHSTQKLSRILGSLIEMGLVKKGKSKSLGRMVYRLTSKMPSEEFQVSKRQMASIRAWNGTDWELEDETADQVENN